MTDPGAWTYTSSTANAEHVEEGTPRPRGISLGSVGLMNGGPAWLDNAQTRRPPTTFQLLNAFKAFSYACAQLNAQAMARESIHLYLRTGRGDRRSKLERCSVNNSRVQYLRAAGITSADPATIEEVVEHPILDTLARPNEHFDSQNLLIYLSYCLDCLGSAYIFPTRIDQTWSPVELWPLQAQYVLPVKGTGRQILSHYQFFDERFEMHEVTRLRRISLRDPYLAGYAPLAAAYEQGGLADYYTGVMESILRGGAQPNVIISSADPQRPLTQTDRSRLEVDVNARTGPGNQGRAWVVDGTVRVDKLSLSPVDLGGEQIARTARLITANCFGVPPALFDPEDSNKATAAEATHLHQSQTVEPNCRALAAGFNHGFVQTVDPRLFLAFSDPVKRDRVTDAKVFEMYYAADAMTPNEARAELGRPPLAGGDRTRSETLAANHRNGNDQTHQQPRDEADNG